MKRLFKLEQQIGKYGEKLVASPPPSTKQNQWIVGEIRTILDKKMAKHSSKPELTQHFTELFCGLDKISKPAASSIRDPLASNNSQSEIIDAFDEKYFKGQATFGFTTKLMMDKRVTAVDHFVRAVAQGGTILRSWTVAQRELFQLHVANKLWLLGDRNAARDKLTTDYTLFWRHQLVDTDLPKASIDLLMRALLVTGAVPRHQLAEDISRNWRTLYTYWRLAFPELLDVEVSDNYLLEALNHVSELGRNADKADRSLPKCLNITPSRAESAPQQIRSALLHYAQDTKDTALLDLLLASSEGEDKIVEAGVIATKLALA